MNEMREQISTIVGSRIKQLRITRNMSQEELALTINMHPSYLGSVERGEKCPTIETIYKISAGLKTPIHELLDIDSELVPTEREAVQRIASALSKLTDEEAVKVAEVVEKILAIKQ